MDQVSADLRDAVVDLVWRTALIALAGAALTSVVILRRRREPLLAAGLIGVLLLGTAGLGAATWRPEALSQPTYTGLLVNANSLIGSAEDLVARFDAYRASLEDLVANVGSLYAALSALPAPGEDERITAAGKHVIVIGGGDTGADCVGNSLREGAASVTQIELLGEPPAPRPDDLTPWPRWPVKLRTSYALMEGGDRDFAISTTALTGDESGRVTQIHWVQNSGEPPFAAIPGTETTKPADLVLLAMGFLHPEQALLEQLGVERDGRGNAKAGTYETSVEGVFAAGDARRGQSLIVWAINEGRQCARMVDRHLAGLPEIDPRQTMSVGTSERFGSPDMGADPPQRATYGDGRG